MRPAVLAENDAEATLWKPDPARNANATTVSPIEQIPGIDLYRELEVDPTASLATIDAAYRSLMKRHHPDVAGPGGSRRAQRLNLAHEWLTDPERKRRYDAARLKVGVPAGPAVRATRPTPKAAAGPAPKPPAWTAAVRAAGLPDVPHDWARSLERALNERVSLVAVALLVAAFVLVGWRAVQAGPPRSDDSALPGLVGPTPTVAFPPTPAPTAEPTPRPTATATPTPVPTPTVAPTPTPSPSRTPLAASAGKADLRFSGLHTEHYVQPLRGYSACLSTVDPVTSVRTITGFYLESNASSRAAWTLNLDGGSDTWSMDMYFPDTADALWWDASTGHGSVEQTSTGFTVDVVLTDDTHNLRVQGTVACG